MCRSIKDLRRLDHDVTDEELREAALQYVRKISGYRVPSKANAEAFENAIDNVAAVSKDLLASVTNTKRAQPT